MLDDTSKIPKRHPNPLYKKSFFSTAAATTITQQRLPHLKGKDDDYENNYNT